jgi:hypothetical protein
VEGKAGDTRVEASIGRGKRRHFIVILS